MLATVGRAVESKGHDRLIQAMPRILERHPRTRLWIIGDGPALPALQAEVERLRLQDQVLLLGGRSDVAELLPCADVYLTGTHREGLGLAVAEGMAAQLPAVGYRVTGIVDIIEPDGNGVLVEDGDLGAFADAACALLDDPERRQRLGAAGYQTALRFDVRRSREQTERIYQEMLERRG